MSRCDILHAQLNNASAEVRLFEGKVKLLTENPGADFDAIVESLPAVASVVLDELSELNRLYEESYITLEDGVKVFREDYEIIEEAYQLATTSQYVTNLLIHPQYDQDTGRVVALKYYCNNRGYPEILHKLSGLKELRLTGLPDKFDLESLQNFPNLERLELYGMQGLEPTTIYIDIDRLPIMSKLESINMQMIIPTGLARLAALPRLHKLSLVDMPYKNFETKNPDLRPLADIKTLKTLEIHTWGKLFVDRDLSFIRHMNNLQSLRLSRINIRDLSIITDLTSLEELALDGTKIRSLRPLTGLLSLKELSLINNKVSDITGLGRLTQLEKLELGHTSVRNIKPALKLKKLRYLDIAGTSINDEVTINELRRRGVGIRQ